MNIAAAGVVFAAYSFPPEIMATGFRFRDFVPDEQPEKGFESLFKLFMQLVTITSGDVGESLSWLNELDKQYGLTDDGYGMGNFIDDL